MGSFLFAGTDYDTLVAFFKDFFARQNRLTFFDFYKISFREKRSLNKKLSSCERNSQKKMVRPWPCSMHMCVSVGGIAPRRNHDGSSSIMTAVHVNTVEGGPIFFLSGAPVM